MYVATAFDPEIPTMEGRYQDTWSAPTLTGRRWTLVRGGCEAKCIENHANLIQLRVLKLVQI
jgi:hypothetical protein